MEIESNQSAFSGRLIVTLVNIFYLSTISPLPTVRHIINHPLFVLTAIRDAVLVFPVPGVPVTRINGRVLCGPFSLIMI